MLKILLGGPVVGILIALGAVIFEQLLAVGASFFFHTEIIPDTFAHLGFFIVAAAIIEESFKYFALSHVLRRNFSLRRFKFIFAALLAGLFFGLTETYFILLANGRNISEIGSLGSETLFSLATVILTHVLTILLIALLIAIRLEKKKLDAPKTILLAAFMHLLVNFLVIQKNFYTNWLTGIALSIFFVAALLIVVFNFRKLD